MRTLIALLIVTLLSFSLTTSPASAQDMEELMKQLQEQGVDAEEMQKMMQQLNEMMPETVKPGTYHSGEFGYTIDIPEGWTGMVVDQALIAVEGDATLEMYGPETEAFILFLQDQDEIAENFRGKKIDDISTKEFEDEVRKALHEQANLNDIEIKTIEKTKIIGHDAIHVVQRFRADNTDMRYMGWMMAEMYVFQLGDKHLNIVYMSPEDHWDNYQDFARKHLQTLKF
ncbi:hypothetical protein KQI52_04960 [bacterium]|nr:hypothetical protein [bacterium]